jgi:hypothetical protein
MTPFDHVSKGHWLAIGQRMVTFARRLDSNGRRTQRCLRFCMRAASSAVVLAAATRLAAQGGVGKLGPQCTRNANQAFFAFQVSRPARFIRKDGLTCREELLMSGSRRATQLSIAKLSFSC